MSLCPYLIGHSIKQKELNSDQFPRLLYLGALPYGKKVIGAKYSIREPTFIVHNPPLNCPPLVPSVPTKSYLSQTS